MSLFDDPSGWVQLGLFFGILLVSAPLIGLGIARVFDAGRPLKRWESVCLRSCGVMAEAEMGWRTYALAILFFNVLGLLVVFALQLLQGVLPGNPAGMTAVTWHLALNTAISFATNTNWQAYGGESTMSHLTQALGLGVQNFLSAATGIAVLVALARGFVRERAATIGNAWVDLWRSTVWVLLPASFIFALVLVSQGVVQNWSAPTAATLLQPIAASADGSTAAVTTQAIATGPAASQIAIKQLGTNGGGFFNANSAHPFENPTPLTNLLECLGILVISAGLCFAFGRLIGDRRQGRALFAAMLVLFIAALLPCWWAEAGGNPRLDAVGVTHDGNWEGKETRFGVANSALWAVATTAASNGSVNAMHDSFTPLGGLVPMVMMQLGEVVFGGVGSGLYGIILFALVAVFVAGLMVGRTPEYLGKKIEAREVQWTVVGLIAPSLMVLFGTALAVSTADGRAGVFNPGPHGFSEILYNLSSAANNNGSAFGGMTVNTLFYDLLTGMAMLVGRYGVLISVLAIAGALAAKGRVPASAGTLPTHRPLFIGMLVGVIVLVGALTFLPALVLGPVAAHQEMTR